MKTCPLCETAYPSHHTNCPKDGALLIDRRELDPGTVIRGKYRIVRLLGRGGMGTVYLAQHILLGRLRALKFISSELSPDPAFLRRFRREAQAAIEFQHPNIVQVVDLDQAEDGSPFIAMEYVEGPDLRQALTKAAQERNFGLDTCQGTTSVVPQMPQNERWALAPEGAFPVPRALAIARGVAQALGAAHAKGIVHRDIKPENILLTGGNGQPEIPKLFDFGIASIKQPATAITTRGFILTPQYAAPEQWKGLPAEDLDARTDLYALGGVLYEMLTGQTCFEAHNTEGWMFQHLTADPEPPSHLRPELANWPGLDALVLRLLARNREQRPKDAAELVGLLDAARYLTLDGQRATEREGTALVEGRAGKRWHRRVPGWMWPTSFLAFLAALVATWTLVSRLHPSPQPQQASQPANGAAIDHNASAKPYLVIPIRQPQKAQVEDSKPPGRKPSIAETEQQAEALFNGDTWSVSTVIAHLIHGEHEDWVPRTRHILHSGETQLFAPFDRDAHVSYGKTLTQLLDEFAKARAKSLDELRGLKLTPQDFERRGRHPALGSVSLSELLATWAAHDLTHLHQISRIMAHQVREAVGPWVRFLGVMQCAGHSEAA